MAKNILIIRSASFQQLDKNLPALAARFPGARFDLLTHPHGVRLAQKYRAVERVAAFPDAGSFRPGVPIPDLAGTRYDGVVVLVSNLSGKGFGNVLDLAFGLGAEAVYLCNLVGEVRGVSRAGRRAERVREGLHLLLGLLLGLPLGILAAAWFSLASVSRGRLTRGPSTAIKNSN